MTYIYDIFLNFNTEFFEYYDWNKNDNIIHIKKIPIYKVSKEDYMNIIYGTIIFDNNFLENIKNKTEIFLKHELINIKYSCLICYDKNIIAVNLNETGKIIEKSDLLIDEYNEIINSLDDIKNTQINYIIESTNKVIEFSTRKMKEKKKYMMKQLDLFSDDELKYIYYELFLENEDDIKKILKLLKEHINNEQMYKIVKIISNKYKKIK